MPYLEGIRHRFISDNECIIVAERQWKFVLFEFSKEVEYTCKFKTIFKGWDKFDYFKDGEPADGYVEHCLDMYTYKVREEILNRSNIKKNIRKQKLEQLKELRKKKLEQINKKKTWKFFK